MQRKVALLSIDGLEKDKPRDGDWRWKERAWIISHMQMHDSCHCCPPAVTLIITEAHLNWCSILETKVSRHLKCHCTKCAEACGCKMRNWEDKSSRQELPGSLWWLCSNQERSIIECKVSMEGRWATEGSRFWLGKDWVKEETDIWGFTLATSM